MMLLIRSDHDLCFKFSLFRFVSMLTRGSASAAVGGPPGPAPAGACAARDVMRSCCRVDVPNMVRRRFSTRANLELGVVMGPICPRRRHDRRTPISSWSVAGLCSCGLVPGM